MQNWNEIKHFSLYGAHNNKVNASATGPQRTYVQQTQMDVACYNTAVLILFCCHTSDIDKDALCLYNCSLETSMFRHLLLHDL